jgi:phosphonate transport system substrate-binding protein
MKHFRLFTALLAIAMLVAACGGGTPSASSAAATSSASSAASAATGADWPDKIVLGLVPSREANTLVENAKPLTDALGKALSEKAGKTITVEGFVPTDYTGLVEAMNTGQADIGAFGPFALLQARDRAGAEIILQSVRNGGATYHTQWMTNDPDKYCTDTPKANADGWLGCNGTADADKGPVAADSVGKAKGAKVSFVEQTSASGYIFPSLMLINAGVDPTKDVTPIFSGGHDKSVIAVCNGDAEVGVSFDDARGIAKTDCDVKGKVVTFAYSPEIPNDGWAVRGELPDSLKKAIADSLLDYAETDDGKKVLDSIYEIDDLVPADLEAFKVVEDAASKVQGAQ